MNGPCPECGSDVEILRDADFEINGLTYYYPNKEVIRVIMEYKIPFTCPTCGGLKFTLRPLKNYGVVFIWPKPIPELQGGIYIPEKIREIFKTSKGVVLASCERCIEKKTRRYVYSEIKAGDDVYYDRSIPWHLDVEASDGKKYEVDMMNILDIGARPGECS